MPFAGSAPSRAYLAPEDDIDGYKACKHLFRVTTVTNTSQPIRSILSHLSILGNRTGKAHRRLHMCSQLPDIHKDDDSVVAR